MFVYNGCTGNIFHNNVREEYGDKWGVKKDIIECVLNLQTMELSFIVNDKNQGTAFNLNKNKTYHFVFSFFNKNDSISVISETIEKTNKKKKIISFAHLLNICRKKLLFFSV